MDPASYPRSVVGVVLAAGASTRMGFPKALALLSGRTFLVHTHETLIAAGARTVTVVVGEPHGTRIGEVHPQMTFVNNPAPHEGMASSLRVGLRTAVAAGAAGRPLERRAIVVSLVDQPLVRPATIRGLIATLWARGARLAVPRYQNRGGHPFVIRGDAAVELISRPESTVRDLLRGIIPRIDRGVLDPAVTSYIDTPAGLATIGGHAPTAPIWSCVSNSEEPA